MTTNDNGLTLRTNYDLIYRIVREWGIFAVMTFVLMWLGFQEHDYQRKILTESQLFIRDRLAKLIEDNTSALRDVAVTISTNQQAIINNQRLIITLIEKRNNDDAQLHKENRQ